MPANVIPESMRKAKCALVYMPCGPDRAARSMSANSITLSARASSVGGTVRPSAFAVSLPRERQVWYQAALLSHLGQFG